MIKNSINEMIKLTIDTCKSWFKEGEDGLLRFVDPIDGEEISAHYGATHAAVSFIIYGEKAGDTELTEMGYALLVSVLKRWKTCMSLPAFHNDFNNFALCVIWEYFDKNKKKEKYAEIIKEIVLNTPDSNNPTVNWFPMRWYVNLVRYQWTSEEKYKAVCDKCRADIRTATYTDGFIDDRLPVGLSFNLQYDVATVAVLQYLRNKGENIDISLELGSLMNVVAPDGDINYLGRGTNQIFAWGLWVYLLSSAGKEEYVRDALNFLIDKVPVMLRNNNMMLNEWPGEEKYMWWDYHYCSVYTAHFLFWLIMADEQFGKYPVSEKIVEPNDSGVKLYKDEDYFVVTFDGRKEYLAEKGPCVAALWTKTSGMIVKGTFGPWQGAFGNKYNPIDVTIRNNCGLYQQEQNKDFSQNKYLHKIFKENHTEAKESIKPIFSKVLFDKTIIQFETETESELFFNIPFLNLYQDIKLEVDGKIIPLMNTMIIKNQYSWAKVFQSKSVKGRVWKLIF